MFETHSDWLEQEKVALSVGLWPAERLSIIRLADQNARTVAAEIRLAILRHLEVETGEILVALRPQERRRRRTPHAGGGAP